MEKQVTYVFLTPDPVSVPADTIEVLTGERVMQLLAEASFQQEWEEMYAACKWATVFQSREYVATWYGIYQLAYLPVLVMQISAGRLEGLLTLAQEKSGRLVGAGAEQAEYQVWLCRKKDNGAFIKKALSRLRESFPKIEVKLKYIPGEVPVDWVEEHFIWKARCLIWKHQHPLMEVEEDAINKELQKKNRKEKINRLKRMGELTFERITDPEVFASIFDNLAHQFDFRKGAMFNKTTFSSDPLRKVFFLALFELGLLHATVLKLNEEIIASNIGAKGQRWVHLQGMNTHAPQFAKYSPGILHFLMLGRCLAEEGYEIFDLSPGGDSYKETLATKYTYAYEFSYGSPLSCQMTRFKNQLKRITKILVTRLGIKPGKLKLAKRELAYNLEKIQKALREGNMQRGEGAKRKEEKQNPDTWLQVYPAESNGEGGKPLTLNKGSLKDLLQYDQKGKAKTRWQFLQEAMNRLEAEHLPFTLTADGRLLACVWLLPNNRKSGGSKPQGILQEESLILEGFYCHHTYHPRRNYFLNSVARELSLTQSTAKVYLRE